MNEKITIKEARIIGVKSFYLKNSTNPFHFKLNNKLWQSFEAGYLSEWRKFDKKNKAK